MGTYWVLSKLIVGTQNPHKHCWFCYGTPGHPSSRRLCPQWFHSNMPIMHKSSTAPSFYWSIWQTPYSVQIVQISISWLQVFNYCNHNMLSKVNKQIAMELGREQSNGRSPRYNDYWKNNISSAMNRRTFPHYHIHCTYKYRLQYWRLLELELISNLRWSWSLDKTWYSCVEILK